MSEIITDAALLQKYTEKAMQEPEVVIETKAPAESLVELPGGFVNMSNEVVYTAEVRELTGADEEAIAKASTTGKALITLLERGLEKIGDAVPTTADIDSLLSGDRDAILLGIRKMTFGNDLDLTATCRSCDTKQDIVVDLSKDVPVRELKDSSNARQWNMETKAGVVTVNLPNGVVQKKLYDVFDKTTAEVNTTLLSGCIVALDGRPVFGNNVALGLSVSDRAKVLDEIVTRNPGPRLGEVKKTCQACEKEIELPLSLVDLFRF